LIISGLWSVSVRENLTFFHVHIKEVCSVKFDSLSQKLVTGSNDFTARAWDIKTLKFFQQFDLYRAEIVSAQFHQSDEIVLTSSFD
jgi:WD40 repeat protein